MLLSLLSQQQCNKNNKAKKHYQILCYSIYKKHTTTLTRAQVAASNLVHFAKYTTSLPQHNIFTNTRNTTQNNKHPHQVVVVVGGWLYIYVYSMHMYIFLVKLNKNQTSNRLPRLTIGTVIELLNKKPKCSALLPPGIKQNQTPRRATSSRLRGENTALE